MIAELFKKFLVLMMILSLLTPETYGFAQESPGVTKGSSAVKPQGGSTRESSGMETYIINPLDRILIVVYAGEKQLSSIEKYVQSDGTVYLPFLEQDVKIGGLQVIEAQGLIEKMARSYIKEPRIVINLVDSQYQTVTTYGKITSSSVQLRTPMKVLQVLARVGGPQQGAKEDSIRVISVDGTIRYCNYLKINKNPNDKDNFYLRPGDIIYVPSEDDYSIMIFGNVRKTGSFPMKRGERLLDALLKADSWGTDADISNIRIVKVKSGKNVTVKEVNLKKYFNKGQTNLNFVMEDGDIIYVPTRRAYAYLQATATMLSLVSTGFSIYTLSKTKTK
jgi:polysaccharide biosynthesis/export protein